MYHHSRIKLSLRKFFPNFLSWLLLIFAFQGILRADPQIQLDYFSLSDQLRFTNIANLNGLSSSSVKAIAQDHSGFLWIGTDDGLNRYDGYSIVTFHHQIDDVNSLADSEILSLLVDHDNQLWIGTARGLNLFDRTTNRFIKIEQQRDNGTVLDKQSVYTIFEDKSHHLWLGTVGEGLMVLDTQRQLINHFEYSIDDPQSLSNNNVYSIASDQLNRIWIGTENGLNLLHSQNRFTRFFAESSESPTIPSSLVRSLFLDQAMRFWIGTDKGVVHLSLDSTKFQPIKLAPIDNTQSVEYSINSITQTQEGLMLFATFSNGILTYDYENLNTQQITNNPQRHNSLVENSISRIFTDRTGIIWIGTTNSGVDKLNFSTLQFGHQKSFSDLNQCLLGNKIYALLKDSHNELWIGVQDKGLHRINLSSKQCQFYDQISDDKSFVKLDNVVSLYEDRDTNIWIGNLEQGLVVFNRKQEQFKYFMPEPNSEQPSILSKNINVVTGDHRGNIVIAHYPRGISHYNLDEAIFTVYHPSNNKKSPTSSLFNSQIKAITVDEQGNFWLGSVSQGLQKFTPSTKQFQRFVSDGDTPSFIPKKVSALTVDIKGNIWIGTVGNGVYQFNPKSLQYSHYQMNDGLASNSVYFISQDYRGNLWFATNNGISVLEPESRSFKSYFYNDGLQHNEFTTAGYYRSETDEMWLGGINGYNYFSPSKLRTNSLAPSVSLTGFELFHEPVKISSESLPTPLISSIETERKLSLNYDQNVLAFEFSALDFTFPEKNQYAFQLAGYEDKWNYVDANKRFASYTNLPDGQYEFKVRAANNDGIWSSDGASITIDIATPPWKSWWAYTLYLILAVIGPITFISYRTKILKKQTEKLKSMVEQRTKELEQQNQLVESLLEHKNEEFTYLSHEMRTPLTLIVGATKHLLQSNNELGKQAKLESLQHHADRLLRLVEQLLEVERIRFEQELPAKIYSVGPLVKLIIQSFEPMANEKAIRITFNDIAPFWLKLAPDTLEKILGNLISNAIKYTPDGGKIDVQVKLGNDDCCHLSVKDNGIGIAQAKHESIFKRFNRLEQQSQQRIEGSGIGLALVKKLVEAHGGTITLFSEINQGANFIVTLPNALTNVQEVCDSAIHDHLFTLPEQATSSIDQLPSIEQAHHQLASHPTVKAQLPNKPIILVVEDNQELRHYIVEILAGHYDCLQASDGKQGLICAIEQIPDLIISDVMMPEVDGFQLSRSIRENEKTSHIPLILLTARGDKKSRMKGWQEFVDDYITKPFDEEELKARIENLLSIRTLLSQRLNQQVFNSDVTNELAWSNNPPSSGQTTDPISQSWCQKEQQYLEKLSAILQVRFADPELKIGDIAYAMHMSEIQFSRKLKNILNVTPNEYLRNFRLQQAMRLLQKGNAAGEVAYSVGFSSHAYFSKCFKAFFGETPTESSKRFSEASF